MVRRPRSPRSTGSWRMAGVPASRAAWCTSSCMIQPIRSEGERIGWIVRAVPFGYIRSTYAAYPKLESGKVMEPRELFLFSLSSPLSRRICGLQLNSML